MDPDGSGLHRLGCPHSRGHIGPAGLFELQCRQYHCQCYSLIERIQRQSCRDHHQKSCRSIRGSWKPGGPVPCGRARILKALDALSEDEVAIDVSDNRSAGQAHLRGAVGIPYRAFFYENGSLRSIPELASLLGSAGISEKDDLMIYSDTFASGEATAVLWALKYLGHEQARALDGGLDNWIGASLPLESLEASFARTAVYNASPKIELLADYDYVISGRAQPVDARDFLEWGETRIDNATWISSEGVLTDGRLRRGEELNATFARLEKGRPVVVYSDDIREASVVWFALRVMGYDARIYRWVG